MTVMLHSYCNRSSRQGARCSSRPAGRAHQPALLRRPPGLSCGARLSGGGSLLTRYAQTLANLDSRRAVLVSGKDGRLACAERHANTIA